MFYTDKRELIVLYTGIRNENVKIDIEYWEKATKLEVLTCILHRGDTQTEYIAFQKKKRALSMVNPKRAVSILRDL